jgi:hypothetical protein
MSITHDKLTRKRLISVILVILAVISLFQGYFDAFPFLPENWFIPVIFVTMVVILEAIAEVSSDIENNSEELEDLSESTQLVESVIHNSEFAEIEVYRDYNRHFKDVSRAIEDAHNSLSLTHIQTDPPESFGTTEVEEYYSQVERWLENNPTGNVRRIISISNQSLYDWAKYLDSLAEEYDTFRVRVATWESEFPMINMALLDDDAAFFALSFGHAQDTRCLRVEDTKVVEVYERYFNHMWQNSKKLDDALNEWEDCTNE